MGDTASERMRKSRDKTGYGYARARSAAERDVVEIVKKEFRTVFETYKTAVDKEFPDRKPPYRQARLRADLAQWFRQQHCPRWEKLLDKHIKKAGIAVVRRRKC